MVDSYTLLIWEEITENTNFYLIPNDSLFESDINVLQMANSKFINQADWTKDSKVEEALNCLQSAILSSKENYLPANWSSRFVSFKTQTPIENVIITRVYHSGN